MSDTTYPVLYVKDDAERHAYSAKDEVRLRFEGFAKRADVVADEDSNEPTYAELQAHAKELQDKGHDLKATGSYDELYAAVTEAQSDQNELEEA